MITVTYITKHPEYKEVKTRKSTFPSMRSCKKYLNEVFPGNYTIKKIVRNER